MVPIVEQSEPVGQQIAESEESIDIQLSVEAQQKFPGSLESTAAHDVGWSEEHVLALPCNLLKTSLGEFVGFGAMSLQF